MWADTPQTQKREFAVGNLYPRILYTFSDVVVFVLRNPRAFESVVLDKLVRWGAASSTSLIPMNEYSQAHLASFNGIDLNHQRASLEFKHQCRYTTNKSHYSR